MPVGPADGSTEAPTRPPANRLPLIAWLAAAFMAGILPTGWELASLAHGIVLAGMSGAVLAATCLGTGTRRAARLAGAVGLFAGLGIVAGALALQSVQNGYLARAARGEDFVTVRGTIASDPTVRNGGTSFVFAVTRVTSPDRIETRELLRVGFRGTSPSLRMGKALEISGRVRPPVSAGPVDYRAMALRQGIAANLVAYPAFVRSLPDGGGPIAAIYAFRQVTTVRIDQSTGADAAALMRGIVLGDRSTISDELTDSFKRAGLAHVLAVSGEQIVMLAGMVFMLASALKLGVRSRRAIVGVSALAYAFLSGGSASVWRAVVMALVATLVWTLGRPVDIWSCVSAAAIGLLVYKPVWAFDPGFQLSFGAVISIVAISPLFDEGLARFPEWVRAGIGATCSAQIGMAPLLAAYFNQMSIVAPVANLAVVPPSGLALGVGLAGSLLWPVHPLLGRVMFVASGVVLAYAAAAARVFGRMQLAAVAVGTPAIATVIGYYAGVWWLMTRRSDSAKYRAIVPAVLTLFSAAILVFAGGSCARGPGQTGTQGGSGDATPAGTSATQPRSSLAVKFLDVGQGDATLLQTSGETVLVDGGPSRSLLVRNLADEGVKKIDFLVITHDHDDHVTGLGRLTSVVPVGTIAVARGTKFRKSTLDMIAAMRGDGAQVRRVEEGDSVGFADGLKLDVLYPDSEPVDGGGSPANNSSIVMRATYAKFTALLTGDVQSEGEGEILREGLDVDVDILKVGHHGSAGSSTASFLSKVSPAVAVISVGEGNPYDHPTSAALARLGKTGARIYRTDKQGDVEVATDGLTETIDSERSGGQ